MSSKKKPAKKAARKPAAKPQPVAYVTTQQYAALTKEVASLLHTAADSLDKATTVRGQALGDVARVRQDMNKELAAVEQRFAREEKARADQIAELRRLVAELDKRVSVKQSVETAARDQILRAVAARVAEIDMTRFIEGHMQAVVSRVIEDMDRLGGRRIDDAIRERVS